MVPQFGGIEIEASTNWRIATTRSQLSVVSFQLTAFTFCIRDDSIRFTSTACAESLFVFRILQICKIVGEEKLVFKLTSGAHRNLQEPTHFYIAFSSATLREIHSNRRGRSSHLTCQAVHLFPRKGFAGCVNIQSQFVRLFPDSKTAKTLHDPSGFN